MNRFLKPLPWVSAALLTVSGSAAIVIDPLSWGLPVGATFRLVVLTTGTTAATSSSIGTYDTFVNTQGLSGITYNGSSLTWQALGQTAGSDPTTDATRFSSQANSVATYNLNGAQVSNTSSNPFWVTGGFSSHLAPIDWTINGSGNLEQVSGSTRVWTGFDFRGDAVTASNYDDDGNQIGTVTATLGSSATYQDYDFDSFTPIPNQTLFPYYGRAGASANGWAAFGEDSPLSTQYRMYAISGPITVTAVPEVEVVFAAAALALGGFTYRLRRSRAERTA